jgi:2-isopropylmalate synthase
MKTPAIEILDTTLRDGAQGEGISFSVQDKLAVSRALDDLGVALIEAGNPGSNPKDIDFFRQARRLRLANARICAFGSTRRKGIACAEDGQLTGLLEAETETVVIFGKSWDLHVTEILQVSPQENLDMIAQTITYLRKEGRRVIYDAEHFFDGWLGNGEYALATLSAAAEAGADSIVLCDTNGGAFPDTVVEGLRAAEETVALATALAPLEEEGPAPSMPEASAGAARQSGGAIIGIHAHNDCGLAVANSIAALRAGARHVQGTLVGFGERCGNTSLAVLVPSAELKLGLSCLPEGKLEKLSEITRTLAEIANVSLPGNMPYVGSHAFSHKAGMHADGVLKLRHSFEHIDPALVGNDRHILMSEVGGRSAIAARARKIDPAVTRDHPVTIALAARLKEMEAAGWAFDGADGSFELLVRRELGRYQPLFKILAYRVGSEHPTGETIACSHAWVKVWVDGQEEIAAAEGDGPVNALDGALRRALLRFFPEMEKVRLVDFKVRVIDGSAATAAKVRVLIESSDGQKHWSTVGVSEDIIDASRAALVDSIEYKLIGDIERKFKAYL